jgi:iron complex outermembrane recepter protein
LLGAIAVVAIAAQAAPMQFDLPAQRADAAILAFSKLTRIDVLFSYDDLRQVQSSAVSGRLEPEDALERLLHGTGFSARRTGRGKFVVARNAAPAGTINGKVIGSGGAPAARVRAVLPELRELVTSDTNGDFKFDHVPPGTYHVVLSGDGYQTQQISDVVVTAEQESTLGTRTLHPSSEPARLDPFVVQGKSARPWRFNRSETGQWARTAGGNLDVARSENDALPYTIYNREQITRSGVVNLNEFLQRELLDTNASKPPPELDTSQDIFKTGSTNLSLRGFNTEETVILVNGRRLPEVLVSEASVAPPDVNFIPLGLVQQVEVLPTSASALYSGNAVGGVINIVLRPDVDANATEITTTYTNAVGRFDAPQSSVSLLHGHTLLGGALRVRFNVSTTEATPPTEAELGYHRARPAPTLAATDPIYRATPNIRSAADVPQPLFGPGTATVTSVAPNADGSGGLAAFAGRAGVRNLDFFKSAGDLANSENSSDFPYGRRQRRDAYYGSIVYDVCPWLQLGTDVTYVRTTINRGLDVLPADLSLRADSPLNPFKQDVMVSLNETAPLLGTGYSEARLEFGSAVVGALIKLPAEWRLSLDSQYAHNLAKYRGLSGADTTRWQQLVDTGRYNPLRDTQVFGPPPEFYDRVLIYRGARDRFVTVGNYSTLDLSFRATNETLKLPTGVSTLNLGADYRRNHLDDFHDERRFGDGTLAQNPVSWGGRTLQRYSVFGELQAPLWPATRLPRWLRKIEADLAVRYVAADSSRETNVAPTVAGKVDFAGGLSLRGSVTTSNRFPTPQMSRIIAAPDTSGSGVDLTTINDPVRNQRYGVQAPEAVNPDLRPEAAVTQTAGLIFQRGKIHRFRLGLDFVDTHKVNELHTLDAQDLVDLEAVFPDRVTRAPRAPGDNRPAGLITSVLTGQLNLAKRHSQNWNLSLDYAWTECAGGTLEAYGRFLFFQRYLVKTQPNTPAVDELNAPDAAASGLLRYRANCGVGWDNREFGFGMDGHYFDARTLPQSDWVAQGGHTIAQYWQFDAFLQSELNRWLPKNSRLGLRAQFRINNVFGAAYPKYANAALDSGVQPYGDWRGRVYSFSLTAAF